MFCDRYVEALNLLQDQRRGKFSAFESSIDLSPAVVGLMHAVHGQDVMLNGESEASDPLRQSHLNAAEQARILSYASCFMLHDPNVIHWPVAGTVPS